MRRSTHTRSGRGYLGNVWLGHAQVAEAAHGSSAVEHAVVEVEVQHLSPVLNLRFGDFDGSIILAGDNQLLELNGARNVAALADVDEVDGGADVDGLKP